MAILGSGNIGTDLMIKIMRNSEILQVECMVGIDPNSDGLLRADRLGVKTTSKGMEGLVGMQEFKDIQLFFDATSAKAHRQNFALLKDYPHKYMVDLTPAAIGPYVVPAVGIDNNLNNQNINMVTCGGQATIPMVAAVAQVANVHYGEIVASIASKSAGPGTRANIDEFTETTARAIEKIGNAKKGKAIIVLNPAEPPIIMRDTVFTLSEEAREEDVVESIAKMVARVQEYVPGYRLHQQVQFDHISADDPIFIEGLGYRHGLKTTILLEVEGAGHYLPKYAGNLDIMTSAAMAAGEKLILNSTKTLPS